MGLKPFVSPVKADGRNTREFSLVALRNIAEGWIVADGREKIINIARRYMWRDRYMYSDEYVTDQWDRNQGDGILDP